MRKRAGKPLTSSTKDHKKPRPEEDAPGHTWESTRSAGPAVPKMAIATAVLETETERDRDATAIVERAKKLQQAEAMAGSDKKVYRGQANYTQYIDPGDTSGQIKGAGIRAGPVRASLYARAITRWDYQPDICKDYKETGYCGFGDSCKFMHDRGDYKSGWEMERDWNEQQKQKAQAGQNGGGDAEGGADEDDEDIPFACYVCRKAFTDPVKTKCGHFFCERCALTKCKTECTVCSQKTGGAFSMPTRVEKKKLEDARKKHEAKPKENDEGDSD